MARPVRRPGLANSVAPVDDEGMLDPAIAAMLETNPGLLTPFEDLSPEMLALARSPVGAPPTREIAQVHDDVVADIPIRVYRDASAPTGVVVYFHGGGFVLGSIGLMDNVARELTFASGAVVVSVGYRLAPEHPYPAGLEDCATVTEWAVEHAAQLGVRSSKAIAVAGESAGGNLATAVALRRRDEGRLALAGQVLVYPGVAGGLDFPSAEEFDGLVISRTVRQRYWAAYSGTRDISRDPYAAPLFAESLAGLPPALVILGGCDMLRDEGRAYAARLRREGVEVDEVCYAGQPHGFVNFGFPAAARAFDRIGSWLRAAFARADVPVR
jgi:acetyl esterase